MIILHGWVLSDKEDWDAKDKRLNLDTYPKTQWIRDLLQVLKEHPGKMFVHTYPSRKALDLDYSRLKNYRHNHEDSKLEIHMTNNGTTIYVYREEE